MGSIPYYCPLKKNGVVYSCDMVRFKFCIPKKNLYKFTKMINMIEFNNIYDIDFYIDEYKSYKTGSYARLYVIDSGSSKIKLGVDLLGAGDGYLDEKNCFIEYNPNKTDIHAVRLLLGIINKYNVEFFDKKSNLVKMALVRFDLAVDIPVARQNVVLVKDSSREYHCIVSSSVTEYSGKRLRNGFTKVYDKTYESDLSYDCTRVEITCDDVDNIVLPKICVMSSVGTDMSGLNATDKVLVKLIRDLPAEKQQQSLRELGYVKRKKIEEYIFPEDNIFKFDYELIGMVIDYILINNELKDGTKFMSGCVIEEWRNRQEELEEEKNEINKQLTLFDEQFIEVTE